MREEFNHVDNDFAILAVKDGVVVGHELQIARDLLVGGTPLGPLREVFDEEKLDFESLSILASPD